MATIIREVATVSAIVRGGYVGHGETYLNEREVMAIRLTRAHG